MRRIEKVTSVKGINRSLEEACDRYYADLISNTPGNGPLDGLNSLLNKYRDDAPRLDAINYCIDNFEMLIKSKPHVLEEYIHDYIERGFLELSFNIRNEKARSFSKNLIRAFGYDKYRKSKLLTLASELNIKVCPYCNSQYTLVVFDESTGDKLAKFQFDHFYPKTKYPFLSLSFYNLIPSCANCNLKKSTSDFSYRELVHPYMESFSEFTSFKIDGGQQIKLLMADQLLGDKIEVRLTNMENGKVSRYEKTFDIEALYSRHRDIVRDIYFKTIAYHEKNKEALMKWRSKDGELLFVSEEELDQLILGNYPNKEDIGKRPLSKFMQDISQEAGLIR